MRNEEIFNRISFELLSLWERCKLPDEEIDKLGNEIAIKIIKESEYELSQIFPIPIYNQEPVDVTNHKIHELKLALVRVCSDLIKRNCEYIALQTQNDSFRNDDILIKEYQNQMYSILSTLNKLKEYDLTVDIRLHLSNTINYAKALSDRFGSPYKLVLNNSGDKNKDEIKNMARIACAIGIVLILVGLSFNTAFSTIGVLIIFISIWHIF